MAKYWSKLVESLDPYVPGEQPQDQQYIKLNTNESPYPPPPAVAQVLKSFDADRLRRYPDPQSGQLVQALADYHDLDPRQVFVGNGSDEVLAHAFQAFFKQDEAILFPDISYSFYPVYCSLYQIAFETVALDDDFRIDFDGFRRANGGIILPNPNAPTGIALNLAEIREMLADNPESVVIIDEAYVDFGAESARSLIAEFENLLVVQTYSKSRNLAGLRLGFALGNENLIEALQRVKNSFNSYPIDSLTSAIGLAALADETYFQDCNRRVIESRERLSGALGELGFEVFPSSANFVFTRHRQCAAETLYLELKKAGILVRYFSKPRIDDCLRITIGTEAECEKLIEALKRILG
jgi:histidinol-phosphate aminotransferase